VKEAVIRGTELLRRNLPLWGWLYVAKFVLALMITIPLLIQIQLDLESSLFARPLLKDWSFAVISELFLNRPNLASSFVLFLACVAVLAFVVKQFVNGGIYTAFLRAKKADARSFFADSAALFVGNLKISIIMAVIYLLLLIPCNFLIRFVPGGMFGHFANPQAYVAMTKYLVFYIFFVLAGILSDFVRLRYAASEHRIGVCFRSALNFYAANWVRIVGVYAVYFVPFVAFWLIIERLALAVTGGTGNMLGVIVELLLFQICSAVRTGQSLAFTASAAILMTSSSAAFAPATAAEGTGD
jgi:hypothetical protein